MSYRASFFFPFPLGEGQGEGKKEDVALQMLHFVCEFRIHKYVIAGRAYDAEELLQALAGREMEAVIPPRSTRKVLRSYDANLFIGSDM